MSPVKEAPYYWVECDKCGANAQGDSEFRAWSDPGAAQDFAIDAEYSTDNKGKWLCFECGPARCPECDEREPGPVEHEHMCDECWDGPA